MAILGHPAIFAMVYILFMLPTYFLPWLGSNSFALHALAVNDGMGIHPAFWLHLICIAILIGITWCRGIMIDRKWLIIFPIFAGIFDLTPGLNWIFGIPAMMHLMVVILGLALTRPAEPTPVSS
jgi:hypothetical protein